MTQQKPPPLVLWILLAFLLPAPQAGAQLALQDSLLSRHLDESLPDTARMRALLALGETQYRWDSLLYYHEQFAPIFVSKGNPADVLAHKLQAGMGLFRTNQAPQALPFFAEAAKSARVLKDTASLISAIYWQGNCNGILSNTDLAIQHYDEASRLAIKTGDETLLCMIKGNLGIQFENLNGTLAKSN